MTTEVVPFLFETKFSVRVVMIDESPWFVAVDVCSALGCNTEQTRRLDDDEKGLHTVQTPGGGQQVTIINESGLYSLILTSRKPEAKKFKKWVTSEVLPAIRKTGRYMVTAVSRPGIPDAQWQDILTLIRTIACCCHFDEKANSALHERLRWLGGVPNSRLLAPEQFEDAKAELIALGELADQHFRSYVARDQEFIDAVLRPPVSIRKVRALVRRQALQPSLNV